MKERSKNAARCRREKENAEFAQLAKLLPLPSSTTAQLDKASVIRLTSSYLRMRKLFPRGLGGQWGEDLSSSDGILKELSSHLFQALDGFVFVLTADGKIIYVSETASVHLGLSQVEMTGNCIFDYIHASDCEEMKSLLTHQEPVLPSQFMNDDTEISRSFCLRMKCVLAKRNAGLATDGYKVIHCNGYLKLQNSTNLLADASTTSSFHRQVIGLIAVGHSLPPSAVTEVKMSNSTFMFRAGLDFTLIYLDGRVQPLTGYEPSHLIDKSLYKFVHPEDCHKLRQDHTALLMKGQATTSYYRLLTRTGGWIWAHSLCMLLHNNRASRQHCILALNHVLSECEHTEMVVDTEQMQEFKTNSHNPNNVICARRPGLSSQTANNELSEELNSSLINSNLNQNHFHLSNLPAAPTSTAFQASSNISENEASYHEPVYSKINQNDWQGNLAMLDFEGLFPSNLPPNSALSDVYPKCNPSYSFYGNNNNVPVLYYGLKGGGKLKTYIPSHTYNEFNSNANICTSRIPVNSKHDVPEPVILPAYNGFSPSVYSQKTYDKYKYSDNSNLDQNSELPYYVEPINNNSLNLQGEHCKNSLEFISTDKCFLQNSDLNCNSFTLDASFQSGLHNLAENSKNNISTNEGLGSNDNLYKPSSTEDDFKSMHPFIRTASLRNLSLTSGGSYYDFNSCSTANYLNTVDNFTISGPTLSLIQKDIQPVNYSNEKQENISTVPICEIDTAQLSSGKPSMSSAPLSVCKSLPNSGSPLPPNTEIDVLSDQTLDKKGILSNSPSDYSSGFYEDVFLCNSSSPAMYDSLWDGKSRTRNGSVKRNIEALDVESPPYDPKKICYISL